MCLYRVLCCKVCCILCLRRCSTYSPIEYQSTPSFSYFKPILEEASWGSKKLDKPHVSLMWHHYFMSLHVTLLWFVIDSRYRVFSVFLYVLQFQDLCKGDSIRVGSMHHVTCCHTLVICCWQPTQVFSVFLCVLQVQNLCKDDSVSVGSKHHQCWTFVVAVKHLNSLPVWVIP